MATAAEYRMIATSLDRLAAEIRACDLHTVQPCLERLPDVLQGAATSAVLDHLDRSGGELREAAAVLDRGAAVARGRAAAIEAAEAAAASASAADAAEEDGPEPAPTLPFF